ncbi:MAG TPA: AarF/UbiB family protein [Chloroflexota bacterium]
MNGSRFFELRRFARLIWVVLKYGSGPLMRRVLRRAARGDSFAVRLRNALEELGLTYVKLGQFLALRFDIVPPDVARELNQLFEQVPPFEFRGVRRVIERELGQPLEQLFIDFETQPVAAASVAQVHRARTLRGERVAVKVQRPGIQRLFAADMRIILRMTAIADALRLAGRLSLTEMASEFATWTWREMNFLIEAHTAERVRAHAVGEVIPRVDWQLTTSHVLTTEFIDAISLARLASAVEKNELEEVRRQYPDLDISEVLHALAMASLRQLFTSGLFHGDPHPGNILVLPDNRVAFVDFGIFGELNDFERSVLAGLIENLALGNINDAFRHYAQELMPTESTDPRAFEREAKSVLRRWYRGASDPARSVSERHVGRYIGDMIEVSRRNGLRMGINYLLCWRTLNALDATVLRLQPEFDLMRELRTFFEAYRPSMQDRVLDLVLDRQLALQYGETARGLPHSIRAALDLVAAGRAPFVAHEFEARVNERRADREAALVALALALVSLFTFALTVLR